MSPAQKHELKWTSIAAIVTVAIVIVVHLLWIGSKFERKADAAEVASNRNRIISLETDRTRTLAQLERIEHKLDRLLEK